MSPADVVAKLAEDCPWLGDPVRAFDQCIAATMTLQRDMIVRGHACHAVSPQGWQGEYEISAQGMLPDLWRDVFLPENWTHTVAWVSDYEGKGEGRVVDFTARQFDPAAPFPWVATSEEFAVRWPHIREIVQRVAALDA